MNGYDITSEPQFQGPDDRNSEISFQEPVPVPEKVQPQVVPAVLGDPIRTNKYHMDRRFPPGFLDLWAKNLIYITREDYYGNMIPLGSFCFAISFIIYGFYRAKVYKVNDTFLWSMILFFGGIGQLTAGFLEYIKQRTYPCAIYLCYGGYCLSHFALYLVPKAINGTMTYQIHAGSICAYYSAWVVIGFALVLASAKVNFLFLGQNLFAFVFFLLRAIGEGSGSLGTKRNAAGILQAISGFFSLFVFISQMINIEAFQSPVFPTCPLSDKNEVDRVPNKRVR